MKCPSCNFENKEGDLVCNLCGVVLKRETTVVTRQETTPQPADGKKCPNHPDRDVEWFCSLCKIDFCPECLAEVEDQKICSTCQTGKATKG